MARTSSPPAIVQGSEGRAIVTFIEDSYGDLVDLEYRCHSGDCYWLYPARLSNPLPWPAFDFGDSCVYCTHCDALINVGRECECGGKQHDRSDES